METVIKLAADGLMIPIVLVALYALLMRVPKVGRYDRYTRIFMAGVSSYALAKFAGFWWQPERLRPFEKLGLEPGASFLNNPGFPSDHSLFAAFLTLAVWYGTRSRKLVIAMAVMTVLVGVGRVLALVHTPLDIIGGVVIAVIGAAWYLKPIEKARSYRLAKRSKK